MSRHKDAELIISDQKTANEKVDPGYCASRENGWRGGKLTRDIQSQTILFVKQQ
jgi:hypothetical protein